jgi:hypothetical protein
MAGYSLYASPTLYSGQTIRAELEADATNATPLITRLLIQSYTAEDRLLTSYGPEAKLASGVRHTIEWRIPDTGGQPIAAVGLEIAGTPHGNGTIYLDELTWSGAPDTIFRRPAEGGSLWRRAWVDAVDQYDRSYPETYRLVQNDGIGLLSQGTREWTDYRVEALITPHMVESSGIAARVQGLRRYVGLTLGHNPQRHKHLQLQARIGDQHVTSKLPFAWELGRTYRLRLEVQGQVARGWVDDHGPLELRDFSAALDGGGIAMLCEEGRVAFEEVAVRPVA